MNFIFTKLPYIILLIYRKFNINYLKIKVKVKSKNIKNYLLDQNFVSGIGNIYASEILFLCKINPFTK